jgi:hypothetical protein
MPHDPLTPLQRDLLRELARTQSSGQKRPMGVVAIGGVDDEPKTEAAVRAGGAKVR